MQSSFSKRLGRADAEAIGVRAFGFLANDAEQLSRFMALSGMDVADLRAASDEGSFLPFLLDYLMGDESLLLAFCANEGIDPALMAPARQLLSDEAR